MTEGFPSGKHAGAGWGVCSIPADSSPHCSTTSCPGVFGTGAQGTSSGLADARTLNFNVAIGGFLHRKSTCLTAPGKGHVPEAEKRLSWSRRLIVQLIIRLSDEDQSGH